MLSREYIADVKYGGGKYRVFAISFLCFGTSSFMDMYHSASLRSQLYPDSAKESCLPSKYDDKVAGSDLLDSPCVNGLMFDYGMQSFVIDTKSIKPV